MRGEGAGERMKYRPAQPEEIAPAFVFLAARGEFSLSSAVIRAADASRTTGGCQAFVVIRNGMQAQRVPGIPHRHVALEHVEPLRKKSLSPSIVTTLSSGEAHFGDDSGRVEARFARRTGSGTAL